MTIKEKLYIILFFVGLILFLSQLPVIIIDIYNIIGFLGMALCFEVASFIFLCDNYQRERFDRKCCNLSLLAQEGSP